MKTLVKLAVALVAAAGMGSAMANYCQGGSLKDQGRTCVFSSLKGTKMFVADFKSTSYVQCWIPTPDNYIKSGTVSLQLNMSPVTTWNTTSPALSVTWKGTQGHARVRINSSNLMVSGPRPYLTCTIANS